MSMKVSVRVVAVFVVAVAVGFAVHRVVLAQADSRSPVSPAVLENDGDPGQVLDYWTDERQRDATGG
ncbi:hypothetical protein ACIBHY_20010 [Nonomuraea sp. NPDC050547]|uniref:hypothetical protein n=1 Tax=unclassified Nonomuraea TaxID=2593643 RepID=UPI0037A63D59